MGRKAAFSILFYLAQGAFGLPVFAMGASGLAILLGPRGGYLFGYFIAAYLAGIFIEKQKEKTYTKAFEAMLLGNFIIYLCGISHLSRFVGLKNAFLLGVLPFVVGDLIKAFLGLKVLQFMKWAKR